MCVFFFTFLLRSGVYDGGVSYMFSLFFFIGRNLSAGAHQSHGSHPGGGGVRVDWDDPKEGQL